MSDSIQLFPNAKINLGLIIKGKRADGYHLLETLLYPVSHFKDELIIRKKATPGCSIEVKGIKIDAVSHDNLCVKAFERLAEKVELTGVHIELIKGIPSGAGLGGGSSDAAFVLRGLNELFDLGMDFDELAVIGGMLGADVPFFLYDKPLLAKGIGTQFEEVELEMDLRIKIITSDIHSSTVAAYKGLILEEIDTSRSLLDALKLPKEQWAEMLVNDLEVPVFKTFPVLKETKEKLYKEGAVYASMSGSGSAVFGLFNH